ncbi:unnamed protein product [Sphagnum balticum]
MTKVIEVGSYTSNVGGMFQLALNGDRISVIDGSKASDVQVPLKKALDYMLTHGSELREMNPTNGWGNYEGALKFMSDIYQASLDYPDWTDSKAYYEFELEKKIAVYPNEDFMDILLNEAKPITMRLYVYIMHRCIRKDEDWIDLKVKDVQAYLKTSRNNLYTAIEQLRSFRFIAPRKGRNVYWINTHLIFNGNRVEYLNKVSPDCVSIAKTTSQYL